MRLDIPAGVYGISAFFFMSESVAASPCMSSGCASKNGATAPFAHAKFVWQSWKLLKHLSVRPTGSNASWLTWKGYGHVDVEQMEAAVNRCSAGFGLVDISRSKLTARSLGVGLILKHALSVAYAPGGSVLENRSTIASVFGLEFHATCDL